MQRVKKGKLTNVVNYERVKYKHKYIHIFTYTHAVNKMYEWKLNVKMMQKTNRLQPSTKDMLNLHFRTMSILVNN